MRFMAFLAVSLFALATPAFASDQFDLICKGQSSTVRYRVDLTKGEACSDSCDRIWKMGEATTGQLKLINQSPILRGDLEERATVNRQTGEYDYHMAFGGHAASDDKGLCKAAPFSGFPKAQF